MSGPFWRCTVCKNECPNFRNLLITRTVLVNNQKQTSAGIDYDVCSDECEARAVAMILEKIVPLVPNLSPQDQTRFHKKK